MGRWVTKHHLTHHRSAEGCRVDDTTTQHPPGRSTGQRGRGHLFCGVMMVMMMKTCCSKLAVLPTLHSAVMIIVGAHTELCLTAATSLLLPLVPSDVPRKVMPENMPTVCITFAGHFPQAACRTYVKRWLLYTYTYRIFTSEETVSVVNICITKTLFQQVGFTWKCDANRWLHRLSTNIALYFRSDHFIYSASFILGKTSQTLSRKYLWLNQSK